MEDHPSEKNSQQQPKLLFKSGKIIEKVSKMPIISSFMQLLSSLINMLYMIVQKTKYINNN